MAVIDTTERVLRSILVYDFLIAIALLIPYGARASSTLLPMNSIPACFSAVIGLVGLGGGLKLRAVAIPFDSILFAAHLGMIVPSIISLTKSRDGNLVVLGTYGTVPLLANLYVKQPR